MRQAVPPLPDTAGTRRRTRRQARHEARAWLHTAVLDDELLEDADARCPKPLHTVGAHPSPPPPEQPKEGRRGGFKVWKTPYWKRRSAQRRARARLARQEV